MIMNEIYIMALIDLDRRAKTCEAASKTNKMLDLGWTNSMSESYWLAEKYLAIYKIEKILKRMESK